MSFPALVLALAAAAASPPPTPTEPALQDDAATQQEPEWEGAVTVGISLTDGNTDITKASASADAVKKLEKERYTLGFAWNYSEEKGVVNQRKVFGKGQYDRFVSEKTYYLAQTSAEVDDQAGVDLRTTLGVGVGRQFKDSDKFKLSGEAGLSWFNEEFEDGSAKDYVAARLAYNWEYKPSDAWAFRQNGEIYPSLEDDKDIYSKLDTRAKASLTENMFAQFQWLWDWDNTPAAGNENSDHLFLVTIGWSF